MSESAAEMEMFLVRPRPSAAAGAVERIAEHAAMLGGVVLMATGGGAVVLGMPPGYKDALSGHPDVGFVGGVSLSDDAPGAAALRQRFAVNAARQLAAQGRRWVTDRVDRSTAQAPHGRAPWAQRLGDPREEIRRHDRDGHHFFGRAPDPGDGR